MDSKSGSKQLGKQYACSDLARNDCLLMALFGLRIALLPSIRIKDMENIQKHQLPEFNLSWLHSEYI
jgi:hypothetical protein